MAKRKNAGGKGFRDLDLRGILELTDTTPEGFTDGDLMEMSASEPAPDSEEDVEEAQPENNLTSDNRAEGLWLLETASDFCYNRDPSMIQELKESKQ